MGLLSRGSQVRVLPGAPFPRKFANGEIFVGPFQPDCVLKWSGHFRRFQQVRAPVGKNFPVFLNFAARATTGHRGRRSGLSGRVGTTA
jgi:hypothetical protein